MTQITLDLISSNLITYIAGAIKLIEVELISGSSWKLDFEGNSGDLRSTCPSFSEAHNDTLTIVQSFIERGEWAPVTNFVVVTLRPWRKFRIEIHSEPIKNFPKYSGICIRTKQFHSDLI